MRIDNSMYESVDEEEEEDQNQQENEEVAEDDEFAFPESSMNTEHYQLRYSKFASSSRAKQLFASNRNQISPLKFESSEIQVLKDEQKEIVQEQVNPIENEEENILEAVSNISMGIEDKSQDQKHIEKNDNLIDDQLINKVGDKIEEIITSYGHIIHGDDKNKSIMQIVRLVSGNFNDVKYYLELKMLLADQEQFNNPEANKLIIDKINELIWSEEEDAELKKLSPWIEKSMTIETQPSFFKFAQQNLIKKGKQKTEQQIFDRLEYLSLI